LTSCVGRAQRASWKSAAPCAPDRAEVARVSRSTAHFDGRMSHFHPLGLRLHSDMVQRWPGAFLCVRVDRAAGAFMRMVCAMERNAVTILGRMSRYFSGLVVGCGDRRPKEKERKALDRPQLSAAGEMASARRESARYTSSRRSTLRNVREVQSWKDGRPWAEVGSLDPFEVAAFSYELDCWRRHMFRMSITNGRDVTNVWQRCEGGQTFLGKQTDLERDGAADAAAAIHDILTLAVRSLRTEGRVTACELPGAGDTDEAGANELAPALFHPKPVAAVAAEQGDGPSRDTREPEGRTALQQHGRAGTHADLPGAIR
jgi:hypothetical protein